MPGRIEVGRYGFRGAKAVASEHEDAVTVDCRVLIDPAKRPQQSRSSATPFELDAIKAMLLAEQESETMKLVDRVVQGVLDGRVVCVRCRMGKHRSQAVAAIARDELNLHHPEVEFEGPVLLTGIRKTM